MPKELLDTITAIGAIATPVLLALLAGLGWLLKQSFERSQLRQLNQAARVRELEDKLREDRIETYNALLEPFFLLFTSEAAFAQDPKYKGKKKDEMAISRMLSVDYRKIGFKLSLVARLSGFLCARHSMTTRSMYAKQDQDRCGGPSGAAADPS